MQGIGIADVAALRALGPVEAWRRLKSADPRQTSLVGPYAPYGALIGAHWNDLRAELMAALKDEAIR